MQDKGLETVKLQLYAMAFRNHELSVDRVQGQVSTSDATESRRPRLDHKRAKDDITWFPEEWIRSYKWEMIGLKDTKLLTKDGKKWFREPCKVQPGNKVAVFHGSPNPMECADQWVIDNWK